MAPPVHKKLTVVGESGVGKTSLLMRLVHGNGVFDALPPATVGAGYMSRLIEEPGHAPIHLALWDTAGQERYRCLIPMYCRGSHVILIVYDVTQTVAQKQQLLEYWHDYVMKNVLDPQKCVVVFVGNKVDLLPSCEEAAHPAQGKPSVMVSAKSMQGVQALWDTIVAELRRTQDTTHPLAPDPPSAKASRSYCCQS